MTRGLIATLCLFLIACGGASAEDHLTASQEAMAAGDYAKALVETETGLGLSPDDKTRWRLELAGLEAMARAGNEQTATKIEALASAEGTPVKCSHYVSTADQLKAASQGPQAITMLDAGLKRFPDCDDAKKAIEQSKATADDSEKSMLESLGYLGE